MFDKAHRTLHYSSVTEKLMRVFGWRQTYHVHRLQKTLGTKYQPKTGSWVTVHNLKSQSDGGILDPDDRLTDVADDREQIIALYNEEGVPHSGGDGTSASSIGTDSPDIFQGVDHKFQPFSRNDIEITGEQIASGVTPLQVRRGSEPALNRMSPVNCISTDLSKRWSAAAVIDDEMETNSTAGKDCSFEIFEDNLPPGERGEGSGEEKSVFSHFSRDTNRLSVQILGDNSTMFRWVDAADRVFMSQDTRKEPLGANSNSPSNSKDSDSEQEVSKEEGDIIILTNELGPLGIHVVPDYGPDGQDAGLLIQGIEAGGRIDRDGRLAVLDRIVEINGKSLFNIPFLKAQEIFKGALQAPELSLRLVKYKGPPSLPCKIPPPVYPRSLKKESEENKENTRMVEGEERLVGSSSKVATVTPTKKSGHSPLPGARTTSAVLAANTRKIGKKIDLFLMKGSQGLGFSITTRDNPAGGNCPIYIKNILPKGAAIKDGTLKPGDRLLEVNDVAMTGMTQTEAVAFLRNIQQGKMVKLIISRQEKEEECQFELPRALIADEHQHGRHQPLPPKPPDKGHDDGLIFPWKLREVFTFDIPVHDTERAGLGVSVKGKTSSGQNGTVDLGIFVKSVINGGAASKDGRLWTNDQLVNINGLSLLGKSNSEAMETLRKAMHQEGPTPGVITLTVARRVSSASSMNGETHSQSGRDSASSLLTVSSGTETLGVTPENGTPTPENSAASENSENTVIFLPFDKGNGESVNDSNLDTKSLIKIEDKDLGNLDNTPSRNPVVDRLTGNNALRNESYYRATHETWNTTVLQQHMLNGNVEQKDKLESPTVNIPSGGMVMIEGEYIPQKPPRSTTSRSSTPDNILKARTEPRSMLQPDGGPSDKQSHPSDTDATYASQTSLEEAAQAGFSRDQFGRQSMSEKRHATLDAKNTDTYQRNKKAREEREKQKQYHQQHVNEQMKTEETTKEKEDDTERPKVDLGPGLGMKKSSSLESLQTMVQEIQMQEDVDPAYAYRTTGPVRVVRGRGCNESFRAAVDRSYEAPLGEMKSRMETLAEEDTESSGSGFGRGNSRQSSLNSALDDKQGKKGKKKAGLLKGLGSMFRFGKHRKTLDAPPKLTALELEQQRLEYDRIQREQLQARRVAQEEQQRIQEEYRKLMERQKQTEQQRNSVEEGSDNNHTMGPQQVQTRSERIHQLRARHQKKHLERHGQYPQDEKEERLEQRVDHVGRPVPEVIHGRSNHYDLYGEINRPGSRMGIVASDPQKYSHYVNYEEIQQHLRKRKEQMSERQLTQMRHQVQQQRMKVEQESRRQPHYHSQKRDHLREKSDRPVSNYYEYESVQAMMRLAHPGMTMEPIAATTTGSLPRKHDRAHERNNTVNAKHQEFKVPLPPGNSHPHHMTYKGPLQNMHSVTAKGIHSHEKNDVMYRSSYRPASHYPYKVNQLRDMQLPGSKV